MCDNVKDNPFAGLFSSIDDAVTFSSQHQAAYDESKNAKCTKQSSDKTKDESKDATKTKTLDAKDEVDQLIADVFGLALSNKKSTSQKLLVFVATDSLEDALRARLRMIAPKTKTCGPNIIIKDIDSQIEETQVIFYLYESYRRLQQYPITNNVEATIRSACHLVLKNIMYALEKADVYLRVNKVRTTEQFIALLVDDVASETELSSFIKQLMEYILTTNEAKIIYTVVNRTFSPVLDAIDKKVVEANLFTFCHQWFVLLNIFANIEPLGALIIYHSTPKKDQGYMYSSTLLGSLFNISCLPKNEHERYDLFDKPLQYSSNATEGNIWIAMDSLSEQLYKVFHSLLKCSKEVKHLTLQWLGDCIHANMNRGKLWNFHNTIEFAGVSVSDGFVLNMGSVLLRLCQPFCIKITNGKVPKIDPSYCNAEAKDSHDAMQRSIHMKGLNGVTCLVPSCRDEDRPCANSFNFITECFFFTHATLNLGYRVILEKFEKFTRDLSRMQRAYNEALTRGDSEALENLSERIEIEMARYLSVKASLLAPEMVKHMAKFHALTAFWLVQVNLHNTINVEDKESFAPQEYKSVTFPLPLTVPATLRCIPEYVVENIVDFLCFTHRLSPNTFEEQGEDFLNPILTMIVVLMKSRDRIYNPHLRARLAEALEALLPTVEETKLGGSSAPSVGTFQREQLFLTHPHRNQIIHTLLNIFVSIEMTGQSVEFEQKFNYRRPMYSVMECLWKLSEHRNHFIVLAEEAESNMEAVKPPLFLRFINLLMNDAVFLLDEALSNMAQLKQLLEARESGAWDRMLLDDRLEQHRHLHHVGMIARFDNILGKHTIQTIKMLTTEIKSIFCHPTMVDRIASMLNYLLLKLVGPNKKNLKVKDRKEYAFNPANLVLNICEIYINLSKNKSFTLAVSQDGRSYRTDLFKLAESVLVRIGGVGILGDLDEFAKSVNRAANQKREEDEILTGVPDEFLDPIMSTIMIDPVILPSSRKTIDRQTIARHLLSDQTDPFNRSPLTMDMVKRDVELHEKIQAWISQKRNEKKLSESNSPS